MPVKVGMVSLGCNKNQVDAERMLYKIKEAGYQLVADAALSDIVIVNTCGFIESAKQEAIETILEFGKLKEEGRIKKIIVTGCLAERYKEEVGELIPEADAVVGLGCNDDIINVIDHVLANERPLTFGFRQKEENSAAFRWKLLLKKQKCLPKEELRSSTLLRRIPLATVKIFTAKAGFPSFSPSFAKLKS